LADDEASRWSASKLRLVTLPAAESPLPCCGTCRGNTRRARFAPKRNTRWALYFQTRQQFPQAVKEYAAFLETYPEHKRVADAREQLRRIAQPDVMLGQGGVYLPDSGPKLSFSFRNTDTVEFKAFKFDLVKYVADSLESTPTNGWWEYRNLQYYFFQNDRWKKYLGTEAAHWTEKVPRAPGNAWPRAARPRRWPTRARSSSKPQSRARPNLRGCWS
jgi:hypothetical protein